MTPLSATPWRAARWLVLAPHPDDETLGAGALIAEVARAGRPIAVAYLTDGTGSHPGGGRRLAYARRAEARLALRRLAGRSIAPLHLDWRDAQPPRRASKAYDIARDRLVALIRRARIDAIAVTAGHEPHCDHAAACRLARDAAAGSRRGVAVFEYLVWGEAFERATVRGYRTAPFPPGRRRHALAAHRSQTGSRFGEGFRLPAERLRVTLTDTLYRWRDDR